jgi:D-beta-D-heptose 7-phosphate kinase/D-beta-D-heptose 1-phosphate adenosyltransferase
MLRVDQEYTAPISAETGLALLREVEKHLTEANVVVLSDYGKGVLTDRVIAETLSMARAAGKPTIVDPKRATFDVYRGATYIKPNLSELQHATGISCDSAERLEQAARHVLGATGADLLVTRSQQGMSLFQSDQTAHHVRSVVREVFDVSGAGDTALAAFAVGLVSGYAASDAMLLANIAAGIAVSKLGTAVVTAQELVGALSEGLFFEPRDRVLAIEPAVMLCRAWRDRGLRIGFTNGCFDILHAGHVTLLGKAADACDRLVVGLNSDASVKRLKGPTRPVQDLASRAQVLASLDAVDLVVPFDEDTPIDLISRLRPDVLVKGADYQAHEVVGADVVTEYGGRLLLVELVQGHSTTNTIKRAANMIRA